jgi:hypothetical protein
MFIPTLCVFFRFLKAFYEFFINHHDNFDTKFYFWCFLVSLCSTIVPYSNSYFPMTWYLDDVPLGAYYFGVTLFEVDYAI